MADDNFDFYDEIDKVKDYCKKNYIELEFRYWDIEKCSDISWIIADGEKPGWFEQPKEQFNPECNHSCYWPDPEKIEEYLDHLRVTCDNTCQMIQKINATGWDNDDLHRILETKEWFMLLQKNETEASVKS